MVLVNYFADRIHPGIVFPTYFIECFIIHSSCLITPMDMQCGSLFEIGFREVCLGIRQNTAARFELSLAEVNTLLEWCWITPAQVSVPRLDTDISKDCSAISQTGCSSPRHHSEFHDHQR